MKKALLVLFALAAIFAGCSKQEETMVAPEAAMPEVTEMAPEVSVDTTTVPAPEAPAEAAPVAK